MEGKKRRRGEEENLRLTASRLFIIALLLLLALATFFSYRTLRRLPNVVVYFVKSEETSFTLGSGYRRENVAGLEQHLSLAMQRLIDGPNSSETRRGLSSSVPKNTRLLDLGVQGNEVTVNLSKEFETGGGVSDIQGRLEQVFYTLTQPKNIEKVTLQIEGKNVSVFSGEGIMIENPWTRPNRETLPRW
jgi:spore germination protein GerM